jgi:hypothetical protein
MSNGIDYSRLTLVHSVLHPGHAWHLFAAKHQQQQYYHPEDFVTRRNLMNVEVPVPPREHQQQKHEHDNYRYPQQLPTTYEYIRSTKKASGRPPKELMQRLFDEYASYQI